MVLIRYSIVAILVGTLTGALGYASLFANGMRSAPSASIEGFSIAVLAIGILLAGLGAVSLFVEGLRPLSQSIICHGRRY